MFPRTLLRRRTTAFFVISAVVIFAYLMPPMNNLNSENPDQNRKPAPNDKVEALIDNDVDKMIGIVDETPDPPYKCRIPKIDPFDRTLQKWITHPKSADCEKVQPDFAILGDDGILRFNETAISEFEREKKENVTCYFRYFDRGEVDRNIVYEDSKKLIEEVRLEKPFVKVFCEKGLKNATRVYVNLFSHSVPFQSPTHQNLSQTGDDVNVIIFGINSASKSMAFRHLPKTFRYLNETGAIIFKNFLKVGENSLSNIAAALTGRRDRQDQDDMPAELPEPKNGFYDEWPLIFGPFRETGYETVYLEDIATFHHDGHGFRQKPADYWYFPFMEAHRLQGEPVRRSSPYCFGNKPTYEIFTEIIRKHLETAGRMATRQLIFSLYGHLSNDQSSDLERADETWSEMFRRLDSTGVLNRTVIFMLGDQGPRYSSIRRTVAGFIEERMPFFSIRIPQFLTVKYPNLIENLKMNSDRLATMFDLHETLLDILNRTYDGAPSEDPWTRGRSLFRPVPPDRTCLQAGVPIRNCLCDGYVVQPRDHKLALPAARLVNLQLNRKIKDYSKKCFKWKVDKILYFLRIPWPLEKISGTKTYFIAFTAKPANGSFEGLVTRNLTDDRLKYHSGSLKRINSYDSYGNCVPDSKLWEFCACKKYAS